MQFSIINKLSNIEELEYNLGPIILHVISENAYENISHMIVNETPLKSSLYIEDLIRYGSVYIGLPPIEEEYFRNITNHHNNLNANYEY